MLPRIWQDISFWRRSAAALGVLSLALLVAAVISREPPDFASMPVVAVVRDGELHPVWAIRLARAAHQIAADSLRPQLLPPGHTYQLWLSPPDATALRPLGLLPLSGRKPIALTPENARLLGGAGELVITLEPIGGAPGTGPSGPTVFRGSLEGSG